MSSPFSHNMSPKLKAAAHGHQPSQAGMQKRSLLFAARGGFPPFLRAPLRLLGLHVSGLPATLRAGSGQFWNRCGSPSPHVPPRDRAKRTAALPADAGTPACVKAKAKGGTKTNRRVRHKQPKQERGMKSTSGVPGVRKGRQPAAKQDDTQGVSCVSCCAACPFAPADGCRGETMRDAACRAGHRPPAR